MSIETQHQIRKNAIEAQEFIDDLRRWRNATKKEKPLSTLKDVVTRPVADSNKERRSVLAEVPLSEMSTKDAEEFKERGNAYFKDGKYKSAIGLYSKSIQIQPTCVCFANRAMAYLKLQDYQRAESDCDAALALDKSFLKAYQRRSVARKELGNGEGALDDIEMALRLQPTSDVIRATFQDLLKEVMNAEGLDVDRSPFHLPIDIQPPLKAEETSESQLPTKEGGTREIHPASKTDGTKESHSRLEAGKMDEIEIPAKPQRTSEIEIPVRAKRTKEVHPLEKTERTEETQSSVTSTIQSSFQAETTKESELPVKTEKPKASDLPLKPIEIPNVPKTWTEFESGYKRLKDHPEAFGRYLAMLSPSSLPSLFKASLTAPILISIVESVIIGLKNSETCDWIAFLKSLQSVSRYNLLLMCITQHQKEQLRQQWTRTTNLVPADKLAEYEPFFKPFL